MTTSSETDTMPGGAQTSIPRGTPRTSAPTPVPNAEKQRILNRLRRLEGQVRGLHKMVEEERPCQDILTLLGGVKSALNASGEAIFEQYLEHCQQGEQAISAAEILKVARLLR